MSRRTTRRLILSARPRPLHAVHQNPKSSHLRHVLGHQVDPTRTAVNTSFLSPQRGGVHQMVDVLSSVQRLPERLPVRRTGCAPCLDSNRRTRALWVESLSLCVLGVRVRRKGGAVHGAFTRGSLVAILLAPHPDPLVRNCSLVRLGNGMVPWLDSNSSLYRWRWGSPVRTLSNH